MSTRSETLDVLARPSPAVGPHAPSAAQGVAAGETLQQPRVLVACSEPNLAEVLVQLLRTQAEDVSPSGLEVRWALDGVACLQELELVTPDLLLLHSGLTKTSALEVLRSFRRTSPDVTLPVVLLTALPDLDVPAELGVTSCLPVPFGADELVDHAARGLLAAVS